MEASIGAASFTLLGACYARPPRLEPRQLGEVEGLALSIVQERDASYLLIDYRRQPGGDDTATFELWEPASPVEGGLEALVVVCDARRQRNGPQRTLAEMLQRLRTARDRPLAA